MHKLLPFLSALFFLSSCTPSENSTIEEVRVSNIFYNHSLTHNSHLNRSFQTKESAFSALTNLEFYLTDISKPELVFSIEVRDGNNSGWTFTKEAVDQAYNVSNNSFLFNDLELRRFDNLSNNTFYVRLIGEDGETIRQRGFSMDNDFPLPASTSNQISEANLLVDVEFYDTPYDGGSIPFPVTIYNTFYESNAVSLVWLNNNKDFIEEDFIDKNRFSPLDGSASGDAFRLSYSLEEIPDGSVYMYTKFNRRGIILYTEIDPIATQ